MESVMSIYSHLRFQTYLYARKTHSCLTYKWFKTCGHHSVSTGIKHPYVKIRLNSAFLKLFYLRITKKIQRDL